MAEFKEYPDYDGLGLAELIQKKEIHPRDLVEAAIARIESFNPTLNAVIYTLYDQAKASAELPLNAGPFAGVPFLLKDLNAALAGTPTCAATPFRRNYIYTQDSELVVRLKKAGLNILGKTNVPQMGLSPSTESKLYGPAHNPWALDHTTGGSSGGSAAAVAARLVPIAHGSDGGGSIRIPASCCGCFGFKPSRGRTPTGPFLGKSYQGLVVEHVITRSVRDSAAILDTIMGPDVGAPFHITPPSRPYLEEIKQTPKPLRIALCDKPFMKSNGVAKDCLEALNETAKYCESLGHHVEFATPPIDPDTVGRAYGIILSAETTALIHQLSKIMGIKPKRRDFEPVVELTHIAAEHGFTSVDYGNANFEFDMLTRRMEAFFLDYDVILSPTLTTPPPKLGTLIPQPLENAIAQLISLFPLRYFLRRVIKQKLKTAFQFIGFPPIFNITGQPSATLPLHWNAQGLPIGVMISAKFGDEATLFQLAAQLENAKPWKDKCPTESALKSKYSNPIK